MHPDQAAFYAKIDIYENARGALYRAKTSKQITFHKEARDGKKKV